MGLPYFPFYPDRWLSSSRIDLMTAEEERGYLRLLLRAWGMPDCTLPADNSKLLKWSLMTDAEALPKLMQSMFKRTEKGWVNPVLQAEWMKAKNKHETMSKNASARWKRESADAEAYTSALPKQCRSNDNQNQNQNHKKKNLKKEAQAPFVLPDWVPTAQWQAFEEMRKKVRKPMTDKARELVVAELDKLRAKNHSPGEVLLQSVRKSWQDVYPIKDKSPDKRVSLDAAGQPLKIL